MNKMKDYFIDHELRKAWETRTRADRTALVILIILALALVVFLNPDMPPACDQWCRSFP